MNEIRFDKLIECVRCLREKHETYESLKAKGREAVGIEIDMLGIRSDDEFIDSIMKVFEIIG